MIEMPVLLLIRNQVVLYDAGVAVVRAQQLISHIEAEIRPNAGHMPSTDQPEVVMSRVLRFLQSVARVPATQLELNHP